MTAILGYWDGETGWIAADGRGTAGGERLGDTITKIIVNGSWLIAFTGPLRGIALIRDADLNGVTTPEGVATTLRGAFLTDGWIRSGDDSCAPRFACSALLASSDGVWFCCSEFSVNPLDKGMPIGAGSGGNFAAGAAAAFLRSAEPSPGLFTESIRISASFDCHSGGRITVANTRGLWETHQ